MKNILIFITLFLITLCISNAQNPYDEILIDNYQDAKAKRYWAMLNPDYGYNNDIWFYAHSFDPMFYNIIIIDGHIWIEPIWLTRHFGIDYRNDYYNRYNWNRYYSNFYYYNYYSYYHYRYYSLYWKLRSRDHGFINDNKRKYHNNDSYIRVSNDRTNERIRKKIIENNTLDKYDRRDITYNRDNNRSRIIKENRDKIKDNRSKIRRKSTYTRPKPAIKNRYNNHNIKRNNIKNKSINSRNSRKSNVTNKNSSGRKRK